MQKDVITIKRFCTPCELQDEEENRLQMIALAEILGIPLRGKLALPVEDSNRKRATDRVNREMIDRNDR